MKRWKTLAVWLAILAVAAAVRLPALRTGLPYIGYVDEGHVVHHAVTLLAKGTWDPGWYIYPTLPIYAVALPALAWSPVYAALHDRPLREDLSPSPAIYYDFVSPADLLVLGRLGTLAFSLGLVVLTGLFARRLAGPAAGWFAAWLAALLPAFVIRAVVVNVNPMAAFFGLAAMFFAEDVREGRRPWRSAALAGVMTGLAGVSKYPSILVCLPVTLSVLLARRPWGERLRLLFLAGGTAAAAAIVAMPALVLRTGEVRTQLQAQSEVYRRDVIGSYWDQAILRAEWDLPFNHPELGTTFLALTAAGLAIGLWDRRWRKTVLGWILFAAATFALFAPYQFRAFRNLLPLIPLACLLVTLAYARLREALPSQPRWALDLAAAAFPVVFFVPGLVEFGRHQLAVTDTREQAIEWLADHTRPRDRVLLVEELVFLPSRIESLPARTAVQPWAQARDRIFIQRFDYLVLPGLRDAGGQDMIPRSLAERILRHYQAEVQLGSTPTFDVPGYFKGNDQIIYILKRKPKTGR
ncbi:MAG TPA: glycosyltransferase family 39 protein [Thermoanaerobaculia bacterium]|nr:glycosyltransferase family 39 protein [Thermoanaerobaculia bacterium]